MKLRIPIEDAVRERVPELKRSGALWAACCPFHDERSPSFKVDPRRGTWHCFGACGTGGDVLSFVQQFDGVSFGDALATLAAQAGVELPKRMSSGRGRDNRYAPLYDALERAEKFYQRVFRGEGGASARAYLERRGLTSTTAEAFGIGFAPPHGSPVLESGRREGKALLAALTESGLVRHADGRSYDFFRGRLMIPIRDARGRTVGFGARLLEDGVDAPKYVNTPETPLFHKGRLIYGLDRAIGAVRKTRHMILVEGYTDVMAAHQVGFGHAAAVLGTATTEDHAALVRRTGARRVTLVFDGDEAGRRASFRALQGLLPLAIDLDVLRLPEGTDPCDLFLAEGVEGFEARLGEGAREWLEFALDGLDELEGRALSEGVDEVLRLVHRLPKPVQRESALARISSALELPADAVRQQARDLLGRRVPATPASAPAAAAAEARPSASPSSGSSEPPAAGADEEVPRDRALELGAYRQLIGAVLLDNSLIPAYADHFGGCPDEGLAHLLNTILDLYENGSEELEIDAARVMDALGAHPVRELVVPLEERARVGESTRLVAEGAVQCLARLRSARTIDRQRSLFEGARDEAERTSALLEIWNEQRRLKVPTAGADRAAK